MPFPLRVVACTMLAVHGKRVVGMHKLCLCMLRAVFSEMGFSRRKASAVN